MVFKNITELLDYDILFSCNSYIGVDNCIAYIDYIDYIKNMQYVNCDIICVLALFTFSSILGGLGYLVFCSPTDEEITSRKRKKEILDFNRGFVVDLENLDDRELNEDELVGLFNYVVESDTPFGKVIMTYNNEYESYWYYADSKNIPYMTLDAVAREYAVKYDCKAVCVNYKEEWEKSKAEALAQKKEDEEKKDIGVEEEKGERDVFANFKSYNTNKTRKDSIKRRRYRIMTDRSNQFSHKGKLEEWKRAREPKKSSGNKREISFSEFKAHQE
tara:strand:+ start:28 stop:849 length:822 start_codon:yes stop_codon:yes gene_type:complete